MFNPSFMQAHCCVA